MARLLECQKKELRDEFGYQELRLYSIALLLSILDIFETDLTPAEMREIEDFARDWWKHD